MNATALNTLQRTLLPCPHCGSKAKLAPMPRTEFWWRVQCESYHCGGTTWAMQSPESAAEAWNRRDGTPQ